MPNAGILKFTNPKDKLSLEMPSSDMKQASIPTQVIPAFSYITPSRAMKIQSGAITITNTEINRKETEGSISAQKIKSDSLKIFIKK